MTLPRHAEELTTILSWNDVLSGAPSVLGFAALASRAIALNIDVGGELVLEAQAILFAARERGSIEIKATKNAYDSSQRLLAVHVELAPERILAFRSRANPQFTLAMLDGFRQLCGTGLVMHHLGHEFSLTHRGFTRAADIPSDAVAHLLQQAAELDFQD